MKPPPHLPRIDVFICISACDGDAYAGAILWWLQHLHALSENIDGQKRWVRTTHAQIAEKTSIAKWRVKNSLKYLEDAGTIERKHGMGKSGLHCTHVRLTEGGQKAIWDTTDAEIIKWMKSGPETGNA